MLSVRGFDVDGNILENLSPLSVVLCKEEKVPADSAELSLSDVGFTEMTRIELYRNDKLIFSGEVDEQIEEHSANPCTEIVARSSASQLLDNEAYPMSFVNPSAKDIFKHYAQPCGFTELVGEDREYLGRFTVAKGMSCFGVIKRFAYEVYGSFPRCEGNTLYIEGIKSADTLVLGGENSAYLESLRVANLRCNRVSGIYVKLKDGEGYSHIVGDKEAEAAGINKIRYLNATSGSSAVLSDADDMLTDAKEKSFYCDALCRGFFGDALGKNAEADIPYNGLYVSALRYSFNKNGEYTKLTLKRKER